MLEKPSYLWGQNTAEPTIVGPTVNFHWRAQIGITTPYWALYKGKDEIGLDVFPTHEWYDWPDMLLNMLTGLNSGLQTGE